MLFRSIAAIDYIGAWQGVDRGRDRERQIELTLGIAAHLDHLTRLPLLRNALRLMRGPARVAGLVTCRQRPATASGVIFVTLEDETGYVNLIVWNSVSEQQRRELLGSRLLAVSGEVQREGSVVHILARRLEDLSSMLGRLSTSSHDFH